MAINLKFVAMKNYLVCFEFSHNFLFGNLTLFLAVAKEFFWFPHMWRHNHAHEYNEEYLLAIMTQNKLFANVFVCTWNIFSIRRKINFYPILECKFAVIGRIRSLTATLWRLPHSRAFIPRLALHLEH